MAVSSSASIFDLISSHSPRQRLYDHRVNDQHDLVGIGVVGAELAALAGVKPALEQRSHDRGVDVRPVAAGGGQRRLDVGLGQRQRGVVVEDAAVEPVNLFEPDVAALAHRREQDLRVLHELVGLLEADFQHPPEHLVR